MVCSKIVYNSCVCENEARGMVKQNAIKVFEEKNVRTEISEVTLLFYLK